MMRPPLIPTDWLTLAIAFARRADAQVRVAQALDLTVLRKGPAKASPR